MKIHKFGDPLTDWVMKLMNTNRVVVSGDKYGPFDHNHEDLKFFVYGNRCVEVAHKGDYLLCDDDNNLEVLSPEGYQNFKSNHCIDKIDLINATEARSLMPTMEEVIAEWIGKINKDVEDSAKSSSNFIQFKVFENDVEKLLVKKLKAAGYYVKQSHPYPSGTTITIYW